MKFNVLMCKYRNKIRSIKSYANFTKIKFQHKTEEHIAPTTTPALLNKHLFECVVAAQCAHCSHSQIKGRVVVVVVVVPTWCSTWDERLISGSSPSLSAWSRGGA